MPAPRRAGPGPTSFQSLHQDPGRPGGRAPGLGAAAAPLGPAAADAPPAPRTPQGGARGPQTQVCRLTTSSERAPWLSLWFPSFKLLLSVSWGLRPARRRSASWHGRRDGGLSSRSARELRGGGGGMRASAGVPPPHRTPRTSLRRPPSLGFRPSGARNPVFGLGPRMAGPDRGLPCLRSEFTHKSRFPHFEKRSPYLMGVGLCRERFLKAERMVSSVTFPPKTLLVND